MKLRLLLAAALGLVLAARTGQIDGLGPGLLLVGTGGVLLWAFGRRTSATGHGHVHGGRRNQVAIHEAGHAVAVAKLGGRVTSAYVDEDWWSGPHGEVTWNLPGGSDKKLAEGHMTALLAGKLAAGNSAGCWADDAEVRRIQRQVPEADRAAAERRARRIVRSGRTEIRREAERLKAERGW